LIRTYLIVLACDVSLFVSGTLLGGREQSNGKRKHGGEVTTGSRKPAANHDWKREPRNKETAGAE
jgi:hypothetical protein